MGDGRDCGKAYIVYISVWSLFDMTIAASPCRTYIVYHHALFAQGVRSVLEAQDGVQIVGMEKNIGKALKAVRSLRPEVVLFEEPSASKAQWPFLQLATNGRVVTLSLDHAFATVYDQCRIPASDPADLAKAIRGGGKRKQFAVQKPRSQSGTAAKATQPARRRRTDS
jgi:DNA-binding NarL/FixJ family response regulator